MSSPAPAQPRPGRAAGHRARHRRDRVPVPVLLHGHRLAAGGAGHHGRRRVPQPGEHHAQQLRRHQLPHQPAAAGSLNSGIFTGGVLLCTVVFGMLAGLRARDPAVARARRDVRPGAAGAGRAVPAADGAALRADRAQLRTRRQLPRHDPAVRDQLDGGAHLPAVLPADAEGALRRRPRSTAPASSPCCAASRFRWCARRSSRCCC